MYFDTHTHYDWEQFNNNRKKLFQKIKDYKILNVGISLDSIRKCNIYSNENKNMYNSVGIHPMNANNLTDFNEIEKYINSKTIAIGETGIDYKFDYLDNQRILFKNHIKLAIKYKLSLIIHCRKAHSELYDILKKQTLPGVVMHCYSGDADYAKKFLELGYYFGFDGPITRSEKFDNIIKLIPIDKIVVETDAPLMPSLPYDEDTISDSTQLKYIIAKIAKIKKIDVEETTKIIYNNSLNLFKLKL